MCINVAQSPALPCEDFLASKCKKGLERRRARGLTTHHLKARTGWPNVRVVEVDVFARVPGLEAKSESFSPVCFIIWGSCSIFRLSTAKPTPQPREER